MPAIAPDRRELLLDAAQALFAERPFDAVSIADITQRAGVAFGLVAHYFGSKRGIYVASMQAMADQLRAVRDRPPEQDDMAIALQVGIRRHIAYLEEHAVGFRVLMRGGIGADEEVRQIVMRLRWEGAERVMMALNVNHPIGPELYSAMYGWVGFLNESMLAWLEQRAFPREQFATMIIAMLVATLRTVITMNPHTGIDPLLLDRLERVS